MIISLRFHLIIILFYVTIQARRAQHTQGNGMNVQWYYLYSLSKAGANLGIKLHGEFKQVLGWNDFTCMGGIFVWRGWNNPSFSHIFECMSKTRATF